jgi:dTDP-4-dehydrorhamnose 3,5-epimerase
MAASNPDLVTVEEGPIDGVVVVWPRSFADPRGRFVESWRREWVPGGREMVQANRSDKVAGSLVGLHYHLHQADYWYVVSGRARSVLHDLRAGSPTEGVTMAVEQGDGHDCGLYIPPGVAHGFAAHTDLTMTYLVDRYYDPADELGVAWDDPALAIDWGVADPVLSGRDRSNPRRADIPPTLVPRYEAP